MSDQVTKEQFEKISQDLEKATKMAKEYEEKVKNYESEQEKIKTQTLKEKEDWKKLAEIKEKELEDFKKKLDNKEKVTANYFKRAEVRAQALKNGIRESALDDIDLLSLGDVEIETTSSGNINVKGADKFVDRLKSTKPHWFEDKKAPAVHSKTPEVKVGTRVDVKDILKLQKEGKVAEYESAIKQFKRGG